MIGIIGAMDTEVKSLQESLTNPEVIEQNGLKFIKGILENKEVVIVKSGVGKVNAGMCAQLLVIKFGAEKIINTGIAGAMGKGLGVFDFVVSTAAVYHDVDVQIFGYPIGQVPGLDKEFKADDKLVETALNAFNKTEFCKEHKMIKGLIASGDQFIAGGDKKNFIKTTFNPACVEMEGAAIAHACTVNKVPFAIVRCMSDMADEAESNKYEFNEDTCAAMCAGLVKQIIAEL